MKNNIEYLPIVTKTGEIIGKASREECHNKTTAAERELYLHPVVHLHVFSTDGKLYLQRRSFQKKLLPGSWDTAVGGHISYGETTEEALKREVAEEIGIERYVPVHVETYYYDSGRECELVNVFRTVYDGPFHWNDGEVIDGKFWSINELKETLGKNIFTPNLELELKKYVL